MGEESRRECLAAIRKRYLEVSRKEKGIFLGEFCAVCGYHPKHAFRLLNQEKKVQGDAPDESM
jgi:hypothetical protein